MPKAGIKYGPRITPPDYDKIARKAKQQVLKQLGLAQPRPEDLVTKQPTDLIVKAWNIVEQADAELGSYLEERDQALAHLWFYDPRHDLVGTVGLSKVGYRDAVARIVYGDKTHPLPEAQSNDELAKLGEELGVARVEDAEQKLLETAAIVHAARIRRDIAVRYMQEAVLALSLEPYGWKPQQIAEHVGVDRYLIYQHRTAARRRHGL